CHHLRRSAAHAGGAAQPQDRRGGRALRRTPRARTLGPDQGRAGATPSDGRIAMNKRRTKQILLVTGVSGARHSTVLRTLEALGWEVVDNLPLLLLNRLLD